MPICLPSKKIICKRSGKSWVEHFMVSVILRLTLMYAWSWFELVQFSMPEMEPCINCWIHLAIRVIIMSLSALHVLHPWQEPGHICRAPVRAVMYAGPIYSIPVYNRSKPCTCFMTACVKQFSAIQMAEQSMANKYYKYIYHLASYPGFSSKELINKRGS